MQRGEIQLRDPEQTGGGGGTCTLKGLYCTFYNPTGQRVTGEQVGNPKPHHLSALLFITHHNIVNEARLVDASTA